MIVKKIAVDDIDIIENVRKCVGTVTDLADSFKQFDLLTPILVRPKGMRYELICGQRRLAAAKLSGDSHIMAIIRDIRDEDIALVQLTENTQRAEMPLDDFCAAIRKIQKTTGLSNFALDRKLGLTNGTIARRLGEEEDEKTLRKQGLVRGDIAKLSISEKRELAGRKQEKRGPRLGGSIGDISLVISQKNKKVSAICNTKTALAEVLAVLSRLRLRRERQRDSKGGIR